MLGFGKSRKERAADALKMAVSRVDELVRDERLRSDIRSAVGRGARRNARRKTSHRIRNALLIVGATGAVFAIVPNTRRWAMERLPAPLNGEHDSLDIAAV